MLVAAEMLEVVVSDRSSILHLFEHDHVIDAYLDDLVSTLADKGICDLDPEEVELEWDTRFEPGYQVDVYCYVDGERLSDVEVVDAIRYVAEQCWENTVELYGDLLEEGEEE